MSVALQATLSDRLFLDLFSFSENGFIAAKVDVTPAEAYFGRDKAILKQRERIKRKTFETRRIMPLTR